MNFWKNNEPKFSTVRRIHALRRINQTMHPIICSCYGALNCEHGVAVVLNVAVLIELLYAVTIAVLVGNENWRRDETLDEKKTQ